MKKIFILTGEPSGDKLASTVISKLKYKNPDIEYLSVGGNHIKKHGLRGVVLQSKKNIFLDKNECIKFANKNKIFINII